MNKEPRRTHIAPRRAAAVFAAALAATWVHGRVMLAHEADLLKRPLGAMVEVDGHRMCVYTCGEGDHTLVFLAGSGTVSPILDFKGLSRLLSDDCQIVVIERFGYGFSDIVDTERSFGTVLRQDRVALAQCGIEPPYTLCPHSMAGLEAILWAQTHPEEVEAIVGLDMALPRSYDGFDFDVATRLGLLSAVGRQLGVMHLFYGDGVLPSGLSDEEKALYRAIANRIAINRTVVNEGRAVPDAVACIDAAAKPDVPMLMFVSDGSQTRAKDWVQLQHNYAAGLANASVVELSCGHYVHHFEPTRIAEETRAFLAACV